MTRSATTASSPDFRALFESAPGLYLVLTPALIIVAVSEAYLRATMTRREQILGRHLFDVFPDNPDDPAATGVANLRASLDRVLQHRAPDTMAVQKYDIRKPESEGGGFEEHHWSPVNSPVLGEDGEVAYIIHRVEDVTEFVRLKRGEEEQDRFFTLSLDMLCIAKPDGYFKRVNPAFTHTLGWSTEEMLARPFLDFVHPDDHAATLREVEKQVGAGEKVLQFENRYRHKDGSWRVLSWRSVPQPDGTMYATARNVTEQKKVEDAVRESEERIRLMVEGVTDYAILRLNPDGVIASWNAGAQRLIGYPADEIIGQHFSRFYPPEDVQRGKPEHELIVAAAEGRYEEEGWRLRKDGTRFWANVVVTAIRDKDGTLRGFSKVTRDLTERKQTEERLARRTEELARFNRLAVGREQRMVALKQEVNELLRESGKPPAYDLSFASDEDDDRAPAGAPGAAEPGKSILAGSLESGAIPLHPTAATALRPDAAVLLATAVMTVGVFAFDLSTPRGVAAPLLYFIPLWLTLWTRQRYVPMATAFTCATLTVVGYFLSDPGPAASQAVGNRLLALIGFVASIFLIRQAQGSRLALENEVAKRARAEEELRQLTATLEQQVAARTAELVAARTAALNMAEDIEAARKEAEQAEATIKERSAQLEIVNKELEAFSYSVSHDLRAPLRHINGFAELLGKHAAALDDKGRRFLATISDSARQMGALVDDLLSFSRVGRAEMRRTSVRLDQLVKDVLHEIQFDTQSRHIAWTISDLPEVHGDPSMLRQVLVNLIGNAVKYTRGRDEARIEVGTLTPALSPGGKGDGEGEVVIYVRDNGAGFDMQYAHKLFGVFQRLHSANEFEGTGIGLANVQRIIHRHGGRVWAEGKVGEGATFYVALPKCGELVISQQSKEKKQTIPADQ